MTAWEYCPNIPNQRSHPLRINQIQKIVVCVFGCEIVLKCDRKSIIMRLHDLISANTCVHNSRYHLALNRHVLADQQKRRENQN